jgi:Domain of unknown function (DUF5753)/Helix-turn-helix domain
MESASALPDSSRSAPASAVASTVPRRVLGHYLRSLRCQAGFTVKTASRQMEWSEQKLWRVETGQAAVRAMDVEIMCSLYSAPADVTRVLAGLARHTRAQGWWHSYGEAVPAHFSIYDTLEEAASRLLVYAAYQVPGLLRTEDYARALIACHRPGGDTSPLAGACLARQVMITRPQAPLAATVLLDEALLRSPAGGPAVMAGQLRHLAALAMLPNLCVRVVPFSAGLHPGLRTGPFTILEFPPSASTQTGGAIVHQASLTGELYLDKPHEVGQYRAAHEGLLGCSLDEITSLDLLATAAKELEQ